MAATLNIDGFDVKVEITLARPHAAGRAFAKLTNEQQIDVLFGAAEGFAEHETPSMQYAHMEDALNRQPFAVRQSIRAFLRNLTIYLDEDGA